MEEIFQKRAYELVEYVQLILGEPGYENPSSIWISLDKAGWSEAKKIALVQFIDAVVQANNSYYLNDGVPYVDEAEVLANFPFEFRTQYATVNIAGVEYWFGADKVTLTAKFGAVVLADNSVTLAKMSNAMPSGTILYRRSAGAGNPEYTTLAQLRLDLEIPTFAEAYKVTTYTIDLIAAGSVAGRCVGATVPLGWTVEPGISDIDLKITHNLNREISSVFVYAVNGTTRRLLKDNLGYSGVIALDKNILVLESLGTIGYALKIQLVFSND